MRLLSSAILAITLGCAAAAQAACPDEIPVAGALACGDEYTEVLDHEAPSVFGQDCAGGLCYGCDITPANQFGPEVVWTLQCPATGGAVLLLTGLTCDIDIYVLRDGCDPAQDCVGSSVASNSQDDEVEFDCEAGETYVVLIEGFGIGSPELSGACAEDEVLYSPGYTLVFDADRSEVCGEICDDAIDNDNDGLVDCDDPDCVDAEPCCDVDADGAYGPQCDGDDCDDDDPAVHPGAVDIIGDGIDQDCSGADASSHGLDTGEPAPLDVCTGCTCLCGCEGGGGEAVALLLLLVLPARRPRRRGPRRPPRPGVRAPRDRAPAEP